LIVALASDLHEYLLQVPDLAQTMVLMPCQQ